MRKLTILTVAGALLFAAPAAAQWHPKHPRKLVVGVALTKAYHYWHAWPSCNVRFDFGALPVNWGMGELPAACLIRANPRYYTPQTIRWMAQPAYDNTGTMAWKVFCASTINEIGGLLGHAPPVNKEAEYAYCGARP